MSFTEEQLKALMSLGNELESAKWIPITPIAEGFDEDVPKPARKKVRLSLAFMKENDSRIRASICEGSAVKPNIQTAGSSVTIIADTLLAVVSDVSAHGTDLGLG